MNRIAAGAAKGGFHGLMLGVFKGVAGNLVAPPVDYEQVLVWDNRYGQRTKLTNLQTASILIDDLVKIFEAREHNTEAFNEAFRNLQSVFTLYHEAKTGDEEPDIMLAKRASKAMEAVYLSTLAADKMVAPDVEKAMMNIQLSVEEFINFAREKFKNARTAQNLN